MRCAASDDAEVATRGRRVSGPSPPRMAAGSRRAYLPPPSPPLVEAGGADAASASPSIPPRPRLTAEPIPPLGPGSRVTGAACSYAEPTDARAPHPPTGLRSAPLGGGSRGSAGSDGRLYDAGVAAAAP